MFSEMEVEAVTPALSWLVLLSHCSHMSALRIASLSSLSMSFCTHDMERFETAVTHPTVLREYPVQTHADGRMPVPSSSYSLTVPCMRGPEMGTSSVYWTQLSRFT
jgi:hypothetical protein